MHIALLLLMSLWCYSSAVDSTTKTAFESLLSIVGDTTIVHVSPANVDSVFGCKDCFIESTTNASRAGRHFTGPLSDFQGGEASIVFSDKFSRVRTGWVVEALYIEIPSTDAAALFERCEEVAKSRIPQHLWYEQNHPNWSAWYIQKRGMVVMMVVMKVGPDKKKVLLEVEVNEGMEDHFEP